MNFRIYMIGQKLYIYKITDKEIYDIDIHNVL